MFAGTKSFQIKYIRPKEKEPDKFNKIQDENNISKKPEIKRFIPKMKFQKWLNRNQVGDENGKD